MRPSVLRELLEELQAVLPGEEIKEIARRAALRVAARNGVTCFEWDEQVAFAQHLLRVMKEPRPIIRDRLMSNFGISRTQAYRVIADCLELSQKPGLFGTCGASNRDGMN